MSAKHHLLGVYGEDLAKEYLEGLGYEILALNWRFKRAEIDIIAYKEHRIIFVEVKTRSGYGFGQPEEFVGRTKQRLMDRAAEAYIHMMNHRGEIRFDIISILFNSSGRHCLRHIEDAFWPGS
ncbi:MAG: YraN family protein [Pedobacter sp.]|jgi:putative endonuclease|nr:MAG: YraN family protein [Pedobacter sp.]